MSDFSSDDLDDIKLPEDLSEDDLESILNSSDPDLLEKLFSADPSSQTSEDFSETEQDESGATSGAGKEEQNTNPDDDAESEGDNADHSGGDENGADDNEVKAPVASKNGQHTIPFSVLEGTRKKLQEAESKLAELQSVGENADLLKKTNELLIKQLEANNISPGKLPENIEITPEMLSELDEIGTAGEIIKALYAQNQKFQAEIEKNSSANNSEGSQKNLQAAVETAISGNEDLKNWRTNDPGRWETAVHFDDQLKADPKFKNATFEVRFAEAVRLTKLSFDDPVGDKIKPDLKSVANNKISASKQNAMPTSLTDIGRAETQEKSTEERLSGLSEDALAAHLENMSPEALDALLSNL